MLLVGKWQHYPPFHHVMPTYISPEHRVAEACVWCLLQVYCGFQAWFNGLIMDRPLMGFTIFASASQCHEILSWLNTTACFSGDVYVKAIQFNHAKIWKRDLLERGQSAVLTLHSWELWVVILFASENANPIHNNTVQHMMRSGQRSEHCLITCCHLMMGDKGESTG